MADEQRDVQARRDGDATPPSKSSAPFRRSGSGEEYNPQGNWGAERQSIDAGDGGFGPEGDYQGAGGEPNAKILGEVNANPDPLIEEAQSRGPRKPGRNPG